MSVLRRCIHTPVTTEQRERTRYLASLPRSRDLQELYIHIEYIWLKPVMSTVIPTDRALLKQITEAQHRELHKALAYTTEEEETWLEKIPQDIGSQNFRERSRSAAIRCLPALETPLEWDKNLFYVVMEEPLTDDSTLLQKAKQVLVERGFTLPTYQAHTRFVIFTETQGAGKTLGVSEYMGSVALCQWFTVGERTRSQYLPEALSVSEGLYMEGKTAIHELGHTLALPHPWDSTYQNLANTVPQSLPNQWAVRNTITGKVDYNVTELAVQWRDKDDTPLPSAWQKYDFEASLKEAIVDFRKKPVYSVLQADDIQTGISGFTDGALYSEVCNYMDYSRDDLLLYFNEPQVTLMRNFLLNAPAGSYTTQTGVSTTPEEEEAIRNGLNNTEDNWWLWLVMGVLVAILTTVAGFYIWRTNQHKTSKK